MKRAAAPVEVEQTLPHNLDAERATIGAVLVKNSGFDRAVSLIKPAHFYRDAHQRIWVALTTLLDRPSGSADVLTVKEELARTGHLEDCGGPTYVAALVDGIPVSTNVEHYARIVHEKAQLRALVMLGNTISSDAYIAEDTAADIIARADAGIVALQHGASSGRMEPLSATNAVLMDNLQWRIDNKGKLTGVPTGFRSLDEMTLGWQAGDEIVIAARPSIGKTSLVLNGAKVAGLSGYKGAMFSMEMRRQQLEYRLLSSLTGIDLTRLLGGYVRESEELNEWPSLATAVQQMHALPLWIDDTPSRTVGDIRAECRRLKSEHGLDYAIIDYIQLMPGSLERRGATRNEEVTDISRRLKVLAGELGIPILVLSQLNRAGEGRADPRPKLSDLRESGALEQDADVVAFLHRKHHREGGTTQCILEKMRNGPTGTRNLTLFRETCTFVDGGEDPPAPTAEEQEVDTKQRKQAFARRAHAR